MFGFGWRVGRDMASLCISRVNQMLAAIVARLYYRTCAYCFR